MFILTHLIEILLINGYNPFHEFVLVLPSQIIVSGRFNSIYRIQYVCDKTSDFKIMKP